MFARTLGVRGRADGMPGVVVTVALGETLVQLGLISVVAVLPGLAAGVGVSPAAGAWILTVFVLALAGTLLVCGRLGDLLGHRTVFGCGALLYAAGSAAAGLVGSFPFLLLARSVQGLGAAMISGNNLALLTRAVPPAQQGRAVAVVATVSAVMALLGAGFGTAAIALRRWPLIFLVPVPLALWAALRARRLPGPPRERRRLPVDWAGASLLVVVLTVVAVALNHPHGSTSEAVMPLFHRAFPLVALVGAALFAVVERRVAVPLIDWVKLRNGLFASAVGVNTVLHFTMMGVLLLGPLLIVRGLGRSDTAGGLLMMAIQTSIVATAYAAGALYDRTGSRWLRPGGAALLALGFVAWAVSGLMGSYAALLAFGLLAGVGTGTLLAVNNTVIMRALPDEYRGVASGMLETTRHFGHALGVTIPTAILALVNASSSAGEAAALRWGFFWSCVGMAGLSVVGVLLALVGPPRAPVWRRTVHAGEAGPPLPSAP